jgi:hypothetical protein
MSHVQGAYIAPPLGKVELAIELRGDTGIQGMTELKW